jgi:hypothetical protein
VPRDVPLLPVVTGALLALVLSGMFVYAKVSAGTSSNPGTPIANINCDASEQSVVHYHAHLAILYQGTPVSVPQNIGITGKCLYWLHTHDDTGVIHIEAPQSASKRSFVLGEFFQVWKQPLSTSQVATLKVQKGQELVAFVDGQRHTGDPRKIPLKSHTLVTLEIGPPITDPPPGFEFPSGV